MKTLPKVYHPKERPWVKPENATSEEIVHQVSLCPSGALSIKEDSLKIVREDDGIKGRFAIYDAGEYAGEMTFTWAGNTKFIIDHTEVEEKFEGKGFGKKLLQKAVDFARKQEVKILPLCPFAKAQFDKDESIKDVRF